MSAVLRCERKPHWFSGRRPCSRCWMRRLSGMRTKVLPAMNKREILSDCHKTAVSLPFVDVDYAGIFELLRDLPFIPRKLEYLCQFSHYDCATVQHGLCLVLALCHVRVFFFFMAFRPSSSVGSLSRPCLISTDGLVIDLSRAGDLSKICFFSVSS